MTRAPKLPHKLKWGDRAAAKVDEAEYLIGIRLAGYMSLKDVPIAGAHESVAYGAGCLISIRIVGYTNLKGVIIAEVPESVAYGMGAWSMPEGSKGTFGGDVFMEKPRAGAYYKYINIKDIVHGES